MEQVLRVGESCTLVRSFFGRSFTVVYAGMPSERVWSLVVTWSMSHQAAGYNLYLPVDQREVYLARGRLVVHAITPQELRFHFRR